MLIICYKLHKSNHIKNIIVLININHLHKIDMRIGNFNMSNILNKENIVRYCLLIKKNMSQGIDQYKSD